MSWCHDDLIREQAGIYDTLTPQEKMARCKIRRDMQLKRWHEYDKLFDKNQNFREELLENVNQAEYSHIYINNFNGNFNSKGGIGLLTISNMSSKSFKVSDT